MKDLVFEFIENSSLNILLWMRFSEDLGILELFLE